MLPHHTIRPSGTWLRLGLFFLIFFIVWQASVPQTKAGANIWTICQVGGCDFASIQAAIDGSSSNDILQFPVNKETYLERITLNKTLTFVGQSTTINAEDGGTAVLISGSPTVVMQDMMIQNGRANNNNGAGIRLTGGSLTLTDVSFSNNVVTGTGQGGALYIASGSSAELIDVSMQSNTAENFGGAIYNNGTLTTEGLTLTDNSATEGGGLYNNGVTTLDAQSALQRNVAGQSGGGVFNATGSSLMLLSSDLANNEAVNGAGIFNEGDLELTNANLGSGNVAAQAGGGLYNSGTATLANSAAVQNDGVTGAGIYNEGTLTLTNSTLSRNEGADGAGLYNNSGSATLNNVTIHLTIGASIFANGGTVTVGNSIISSVFGQAACGGGGTFISNGYNLASDQSCTFLTANGDRQGLDPNLSGISSPADSAVFHLPRLTSPVVDAGNPAAPGSSSAACLASDQRGLARPQSRQCDIGAVEIVVYRLYVPSVTK